MLAAIRTGVSALLTLAAEPFRWWHDTLTAAADYVEPTPVWDDDDYARAAAVIAAVQRDYDPDTYGTGTRYQGPPPT